MENFINKKHKNLQTCYSEANDDRRYNTEEPPPVIIIEWLKKCAIVAGSGTESEPSHIIVNGHTQAHVKRILN